jgi:S-adenosyl-L-methionine hydrolase (adenosine-forming)
MENLRAGPGDSQDVEREGLPATAGRAADAPWNSPAGRRRPIVTLLTDFGLADPFVGIMKGVILSRCPEAAIVDLCHEVPPQHILAGAFLLHTATPFFPPGTIHVAVVDPGVGSARRALVARIRGQVFLAPDNGLLSYALETGPVEMVRAITARTLCLPEVSTTFHGRDIFAAVAGHLAGGLSPDLVGPDLPDPLRLPIPRPRVEAGVGVIGEVLWIDRFGNCLTTIRRQELAGLVASAKGPLRVFVRDRPVGSIVGHFAEAGRGEPGAVIGSTGHLELFMAQGSLAAAWGIAPGDPVVAADPSASPASPTCG